MHQIKQFLQDQGIFKTFFPPFPGQQTLAWCQQCGLCEGTFAAAERWFQAELSLTFTIQLWLRSVKAGTEEPAAFIKSWLISCSPKFPKMAKVRLLSG